MTKSTTALNALNSSVSDVVVGDIQDVCAHDDDDGEGEKEEDGRAFASSPPPPESQSSLPPTYPIPDNYLQSKFWNTCVRIVKRTTISRWLIRNYNNRYLNLLTSHGLIMSTSFGALLAATVKMIQELLLTPVLFAVLRIMKLGKTDTL